MEIVFGTSKPLFWNLDLVDGVTAELQNACVCVCVKTDHVLPRSSPGILQCSVTQPWAKVFFSATFPPFDRDVYEREPPG